ncbi:RES domain protein [Pseudomonas sp. CF161]|nr:RES domain protein [Pseudomonas sp. CF161]
MWEEDMGRGYSSVEDTYVCARCIQDQGLKKFIRRDRSPGTCSYCHKSVKVSAMDSVIEHVVNSLCLEWGDPANEGLPYEPREGGWQGDVYNIWELLDDVGPDCPEEILDTIAGAIHDTGWCERDPYSLPVDKILVYGWQSFSRFIIHTARFVFYKAVNPAYDGDQHDEMNPVDILETLGRVVRDLGLIDTVPAGEKIYRVRIVNQDEVKTQAKDLGPPPAERANMPNRMSPVGIPMFYGAFDLNTAIRETYEPSGAEGKKAASGEFTAVRNLRVVDLSKSFFIPSLFDPELQNLRNYYRFMSNFISDFTKPIERSERAHADYVPTQVVTEYFRHVYRTDDGAQIDGIIYPSSKTGQKAIVIFADSAACINAGETPGNGTLLRLDKAVDVSLETRVAFDDDEIF